MVTGLWARVTGNAGNSLAADLKRVTDSGVTEMPKELLTVVVDSTHDPDSRREIMAHLRECLQEQASKRWRRVYAGLVLAEDLLQRGSQDLLTETAEGHHFDMVQQLSLLEHYSKVDDRRIQNMVRAKASALKKEVMSKLQSVRDDDTSSYIKDTYSTCSPGSASVTTSGTSETGGSGKSHEKMTVWEMPTAPTRQMILNGVVSVGHRDDTSSESSGDEAIAAAPVAFRDLKPKSRKSDKREKREKRDKRDKRDKREKRRSKKRQPSSSSESSGSESDSSSSSERHRGSRKGAGSGNTGSNAKSKDTAGAPPVASVDLLDL